VSTEKISCLVFGMIQVVGGIGAIFTCALLIIGKLDRAVGLGGRAGVSHFLITGSWKLVAQEK